MKPIHVGGIIALVFGAIICINCAGCAAGGFEFSEGFREGHVQKFSHKGIIWKTWEGEMALPGFKQVGTGDEAHMSNTFEFSVVDPQVQKEIQALHATEYVRLYYKQYFASPPTMGNSQYRIVKVEKLQEGK